LIVAPCARVLTDLRHIRSQPFRWRDSQHLQNPPSCADTLQARSAAERETEKRFSWGDAGDPLTYTRQQEHIVRALNFSLIEKYTSYYFRFTVKKIANKLTFEERFMLKVENVQKNCLFSRQVKQVECLF
jgi:hypothetical protein